MILHGLALMIVLGLAACSQPDRRTDQPTTAPRIADLPTSSAGQSLAGEPSKVVAPVDEPVEAALQPIEDAGVGGPGLDGGMAPMDGGLPPLGDDGGLPSPPPLPGPGDAGLPM